ncbi:MAG: 50S ribosomal protein L28 [Rickettsiales endosymbiont of Dermacentor nuttalli]
MTRRCSLTSKSVLVGHKVSHSNKKSKKRFLPNLQKLTLISEMLGCKVRLRISPNALRTVESKGGLDFYLLQTNDEQLSVDALDVKRRVKKMSKLKEQG